MFGSLVLVAALGADSVVTLPPLPPFPPSANLESDFNETQPTVAWTDDGNGFGVVWVDDRLGPFALFARFFDSQGVQTSAHVVMPSNVALTKPALVGDVGGGFTLAFERGRGSPVQEVVVARANSTIQNLTTKVLPGGAPALARLPDGGTLLAFSRLDGGLVVQNVDALFADVNTGELWEFPGTGTISERLALAASNDEVAVLAANRNDLRLVVGPHGGVPARRNLATGTPGSFASPTVAFDPRFSNLWAGWVTPPQPASTATFVDGGVGYGTLTASAVVLTTSSLRVVAATLDPNSQVLALYDSASAGAASFSMPGVGTELAAASVDTNIVLAASIQTTNGHELVPVLARQLGPGTFAFSRLAIPRSIPQRGAKVVLDSSGGLVVWKEGSSDLKAARLDASLTIAGPPITLQHLTGRIGEFDLAAGTDGTLIVYRVGGELRFDLLANDGTLTPVAQLVTLFPFAVAFDGREFRVAMVRGVGANTELHLVAPVLDGSGTVTSKSLAAVASLRNVDLDCAEGECVAVWADDTNVFAARASAPTPVQLMGTNVRTAVAAAHDETDFYALWTVASNAVVLSSQFSRSSTGVPAWVNGPKTDATFPDGGTFLPFGFSVSTGTRPLIVAVEDGLAQGRTWLSPLGATPQVWVKGVASSVAFGDAARGVVTATSFNAATLVHEAVVVPFEVQALPDAGTSDGGTGIADAGADAGAGADGGTTDDGDGGPGAPVDGGTLTRDFSSASCQCSTANPLLGLVVVAGARFWRRRRQR